jgi:tRNA-specific 2-thiouridylase
MSSGVNLAGKRVVVGLTGRVASAVAAFLLKKQGMDVIGVSIVTTNAENYEDKDLLPKCHIADLQKVQAFCEDLKIPFYATDGKSQFEYEVLDPLVSTRLTCGTNQSCYNCTSFRLEILYQKMKKLRADYIATGHFCKVQKNITANEYFIHSTGDAGSDQSFLLSGINEKFLKHLLLPLGELRAEEVHKIAKNFDLKTTKSISMDGFCFEKPESLNFYADKVIPPSLIEGGQVVNVETESFHGDHEGIAQFYITQKELSFKGVNPGDKDLEIVGYDYVKKLIQIGSSKYLTHKSCQLVELKLSKGFDRSRAFHCFIKYKYTNEFVKCVLYFKNNSTAFIEFDIELYPVISGETLVLFDKNTRNAKVIGKAIVGNGRNFELLDRVSEFRRADNGDHMPKSNIPMFKF